MGFSAAGTAAAAIQEGNATVHAGQMLCKADVNPRLFTFVGGKVGKWSVTATKAVVGDSLATTKRLDVVHGSILPLPDGAKWALSGVTSKLHRNLARLEPILSLLQAQSFFLGSDA